jgi:hypothetical protein
MIDVEPMIREKLRRRFPLPDAARADWEDALRRAGISHSRRRRPLLAGAVALAALTVTLAATPLGASLTGAVGDFSRWLTGRPGTSAPASEQRAFERSTEQTWSFPERPELRTLLRMRVGATEYALYGFRSGNAICLRLSVHWRVRVGSSLNCVARSELEHSRDLVVPLQANVRFGRVDAAPGTGAPTVPRAIATFGFVANGVREVRLASDRRTTPALVANGAFLHVLHRPARGEWVRVAVASDDRGRSRRLPILVMAAGQPPLAHPLRARGPASIERELTGGTIGWFAHREPRGEPLSPKLRRMLNFGPVKIGEFARVVQPDPNDFQRTVLAERAGRPGELCTFSLPGGGGSCGAFANAFAQAPLSLSWSSGRGQQFWIVQGLASDDVARVEAFLATGERRPLALADNVVAGLIPAAKLPARIVGYDDQGHVISVTKIPSLVRRSRPRPIVSTFRTLVRAQSESGTSAALRVARSNAGGRCFEIRSGNAVGAAGCYGKRWRGPTLQLALQGQRLAWFIYGRVHSGVRSLEIGYQDGDRTTATVMDGYTLSAVPTRHAQDGHRATLVIGLDASGHEVGRQDFRRR